MKLSPGLDRRFSEIELAASPLKTPKKRYPKTLYPSNSANFTTPLKAPTLSTALRAELRSVSSSRIREDAENAKIRVASKRLSGFRTDPKPSLPREKAMNFSFMRETSSSKSKSARPVRAVSHPESFNKRHQASKRHVSVRLDMERIDRRHERKPRSVAELRAIVGAVNALYLAFYSDEVAHTNKPKLPLAVLELQLLTVYERGEIMRKLLVYYVPAHTHDVDDRGFKNNYGFDDKDGNYLAQKHDHVEYRYEVERKLGSGSFGEVFLCIDHKHSAPHSPRRVAVKIIKNRLDWSVQAVSEIKLLRQLAGNKHIMAYHDHFNFRGHTCIVTEALLLNLYTLLELTSFKGLALPLVKTVSTQILKALAFMHSHRIIHCDVKPENVMLSFADSDVLVKVIDFGSSCYKDETTFSYIQLRFYRAPEVLLGTKYSTEIDVWSLGCVACEMCTGHPLLSGRTELEQMALAIEIFGVPSSAFIAAERKLLKSSTKSVDIGSRLDEKKLRKSMLYQMFGLDGKLNTGFVNLQLQQLSTGSLRYGLRASLRSLMAVLNLQGETRANILSFLDFLDSIFVWDPSKRALAATLLGSAFVSSGD